MRVSGIRIYIEMPIPINFNGSSPYYEIPCYKDCNGTIYEINAIKDACNEISNLPIIMYNKHNNPVVVGIAETIKFNSEKSCIVIDGVLNFGGTCEETIFSSTKNVIDMTIESIGLGV